LKTTVGLVDVRILNQLRNRTTFMLSWSIIMHNLMSQKCLVIWGHRAA